MGQLSKIRRMYHRDKVSIREIAKYMGLSRNTVRAWLRRSDDVKQPAYATPQRPRQLDDYSEPLNDWLTANQHRNKRERRTTLSMFAELKLKGYTGSPSQVYRYAKRWKSEQSTGLKNAFMPLKFEHGEAAQFDWSTESAFVAGVQRTFKLAHMKLCSSRAFHLSAYPGESHEMLFDAHSRAFTAFGGVPKRIIYDNMKTAVDKVLPNKQRTINVRFAVMCSHYLFEPDFCNVAAGWEKGIVEKNVQDTRARLGQQLRETRWASWDELNAWLDAQCKSLWQTLKHPRYQLLSISDVLKDESSALIPMPRAFDGYTHKSVKVSSTGLVRLDNNHYSVPIELAQQAIDLHIYPFRVVIVHNNQAVAEHVRATGRDGVVYDWQHYIPLLILKPGAIRNGAPFAEMPEPLRRVQYHVLQHDGGDRLMASLLAMVPVHGLDAVLVAVELALEAGAPNVEHIINIISRLQATGESPVVKALELNTPSQANVARYDALLKAVS
jgi:transposase